MHVLLEDGRRLGYADWGRRDGRPVLYLHGALGSPVRRCAATDRVLDELGVRYLLVQRPGFGGSDPCPGRTLRCLARDVDQLADHLDLGDDLHVLGVSAGGPYAAAVAHDLPARVRAAAIVSGLGCGGAPGAFAGTSLAQRAALAALRRHPRAVRDGLDGLARLAGRHPGLVVALLARRAGADGRTLADPQAAAELRASLDHATRGGAGAMVDDLVIATGDWGFDPAGVRAHVHLWHGTDDPAVPLEQALQLSIAFPHCTPAFAPGEGHFFFRRRMREILAALVGQADEPRMVRATSPGSSHVGT